MACSSAFLLPPRVPHSPQRMANSIGLVIERRRQPHELDGLMWYCERCNEKLYEEFFPLRDIENDFPAVFARFYSSKEHRTCKGCNHVNPAPAKYDTPENRAKLGAAVGNLRGRSAGGTTRRTR